MDQALDWIFDKIQGLGFAAALLAFLLAVSSGMEHAAREQVILLAVWAAAIAFYWLGHYLDRLVYDPLFGVSGRWSRVLDRERDRVRAKLRSLGWPDSELQATARSLFESSSAWQDKVRHSYEASKACRSFVLPMLMLCLYELIAPHLGLPNVFSHSPLGWPGLAAGLCVAALGLYLGLRILHNKRLYSLVAEAELITPQDLAEYGQRMVLTDVVPGRRENVSYCFLCFRRELPGGERVPQEQPQALKEDGP